MPEYVVRYGSMRLLGVMSASAEYQYKDEVVVLTDRGSEQGTILCEATPAALESMPESTAGKILRQLTAQDRAQAKHLADQTSRLMGVCQRYIQSLQLDMELVDLEQILGSERIIIYFLAPQRVDFRQLVRELASEFQTRIEMRQVGVRDEAKLLADYGDCGRPICCANHLSKMPPVSMRMAKLQKATLDPNKISGRCGRLKCCLRYEFDTYEQIARELPAVGTKVLTRDGRVTVVAHDLLAEQLVVSTPDKRRILISASDVLLSPPH